MARKQAVQPVTQAVLYFRVSTDKQERSGLGLESQATRCRLYAQSQGLTTVAEYTEAMSAKTLQRPELQKAIASLRPGVVLIALKLDRIIRTASDLDRLTDAVKAQGGEWATVEGNYDTSTPMGAFMVRLVADIAQLERETIGQRTRQALEAKQGRGEHVGNVPYGYMLVDGRLVEDPAGQALLSRVRALREEGMSYRAITQRLNGECVPTQSGTGRWSQSTVWLMCQGQAA